MWIHGMSIKICPIWHFHPFTGPIPSIAVLMFSNSGAHHDMSFQWCDPEKSIVDHRAACSGNNSVRPYHKPSSVQTRPSTKANPPFAMQNRLLLSA